MPGIIDKVLNKFEGNSSPTSSARTGSVSSKADTATTPASSVGSKHSMATGGRAREGDDLALREGTGPGTTGRRGPGSNLNGPTSNGAGFTNGANGTNDVGMTDATGERGIHGTGTHGHLFRGANGEGAEHTFGHQPKEGEAVPDRLDAGSGNVHHSALHLGHKTHEKVLHPEIEEVTRQREQERHVHHVQHHVQPVLHREEQAEVHQQNAIPVTKIHEKHVNEDQGDRDAYIQLGAKHEDKLVHAPAERKVVDMGETVNETVHHHVHNVIQPIIQKETVAPTRIHTTVPMHHVVHEAPIVHSSISHEPMHRDEFLKQGGRLGEGLTHESAADRLLGGECERNVQGEGENLLQEMGIGHTTTGAEGKIATA